jgi:hypothetical protein
LEYQSRAEAAGIGDIDRQGQYALLTLFTSGKWIEHPTFVEFIKTPPASFADFYSHLQALPEDLWNSGESLWISTTPG